MKYETTAAVSLCSCEELDRVACMRRLASERVGHLGLTAKALPVVHPIRYRLIGQSLVFATASQATIASARHHAVACIEVSGVDNSSGEDWTVLATGRLHETADPTTTWADESPMPPAWGARNARHYVALDIELLSGTSSTAACAR